MARRMRTKSDALPPLPKGRGSRARRILVGRYADYPGESHQGGGETMITVLSIVGLLLVLAGAIAKSKHIHAEKEEVL